MVTLPRGLRHRGAGRRGRDARRTSLADALENSPRKASGIFTHQGHVTHLTERDHQLLDHADDGLATIAEAGEIASRIAGLSERGVGEVIYTPSGKDVARELEAFYAAAQDG